MMRGENVEIRLESVDSASIHEKDFICLSLIIHGILRTLFLQMNAVNYIRVPDILTRSLLAAGMLAFAVASPSLALSEPGAADAQICESPALAPDVVSAVQADVDLELDFLTVLTTGDLSHVPGAQTVAWHSSAPATAQDYTPLSLLLVAAQATTTDL